MIYSFRKLPFQASTTILLFDSSRCAPWYLYWNSWENKVINGFRRLLRIFSSFCIPCSDHCIRSSSLSFHHSVRVKVKNAWFGLRFHISALKTNLESCIIQPLVHPNWTYSGNNDCFHGSRELRKKKNYLSDHLSITNGHLNGNLVPVSSRTIIEPTIISVVSKRSYWMLTTIDQ